MKIIWTEPSVADLENLKEYISKDSEKYATAFIEKIFQSVEKLEIFPLLGRVVPEDDNEKLREIIVSNYRIIYRVKKDHILIIAILHGAMDLSGKKKKPWNI